MFFMEQFQELPNLPYNLDVFQHTLRHSTTRAADHVDPVIENHGPEDEPNDVEVIVGGNCYHLQRVLASLSLRLQSGNALREAATGTR